MICFNKTRISSKYLLTLLLFANCFYTQAQKGAKNITVGAIVSIPSRQEWVDGSNGRFYKTGVGLEATGQLNFTNRSALLIQPQYCTYRLHNAGTYPDSFNKPKTFNSVLVLRAGYQYQFGKSGILLNALGGWEFESDWVPVLCIGAGIGKRFHIKEAYFVDAGVEYITGNVFESRLNIKAAFSIFRRPRPTGYYLW